MVESFGSLTVSGTAVLDGISRIRLVNGYLPSAGQLYAIMTYDTRSGAFAVIEDEDAQDSFTYDLDYGLDTLGLIAVPV